MKEPSIRRQLLVWVLGALCVGAVSLVVAAYWLTLHEIDEVMDDSLMQTALLLADKDLRGAISKGPGTGSYADTESGLIAIIRDPGGTLLFTSEPGMSLTFAPTPGTSRQKALGSDWNVYTVVQSDRCVQVVQPAAARREAAAESASQLLVPLTLLIALIGTMLVVALRRGMKPLEVANRALGQRSPSSLQPLDLTGVPVEIAPVVRTLNDLLRRLDAAFEAQRHFVADAAHELRSPVTALQLQVQILERSHDQAERSSATAELAAGIARARRLIEQLLNLSRASTEQDSGNAPSRTSFDLAELARDGVVRWTQEAERRGIDLGANASSSLVTGDRDQLDVLLNNLIDNSLRYTPRGGVVDVVTRDIDGKPTLSVVDNGPGLSDEERSRVFDRFYRSPDAIAGGESGSGLGLAIVKSIAEQHEAVVSLLGVDAGSGLEVRVSFPKAN